MKLLTKDLDALKRTDLTYTQIGILLTRMLSDNLGNDRAVLSLMQGNRPIAKSDLIALHEKGLISWSGYKAAKRTEIDNTNNISIKAKNVIDFMNKMYGRKFSAGTSKVSSLLRSGYTEEELKLVVANRWKVWADDDYMAKYLVPSTIFRASNFEKYLEEAEHGGVGKSIVEADTVGFDKGDILQFSDIKRLSENEVYVVRVKEHGSNKVK